MIENFYVGINISGVLRQVPTPGLLGAFPGLHLDDGQAAIKISVHYLLGQVRIGRDWLTKPGLIHGILPEAFLSLEPFLQLLYIKSNFRATDRKKTAAWTNPELRLIIP